MNTSGIDEVEVPRIYTRCPACGNDTLTINKGHLLCTWFDCKDPTLIDRAGYVKADGDWFLTYTGRKFWPTNPRAEDVCIEDVAHHLSLLCRFNGACRQFYSVAQHSLLVEEIHPGLPSLLHDATEAYVGDIIRPLKRSLPQYKEVERRVWLAVCRAFKIEPNLDPRVKDADNRALMTEKRDLLVITADKWDETAEPVERKVNPMHPEIAESLFLNRYEELTRKA